MHKVFEPLNAEKILEIKSKNILLRILKISSDNFEIALKTTRFGEIPFFWTFFLSFESSFWNFKQTSKIPIISGDMAFQSFD